MKKNYTMDKYKAAYLKWAGCRYLGIELSPRKKELYFFEDTEDYRHYESDFMNNEYVREFIKNIKGLYKENPKETEKNHE